MLSAWAGLISCLYLQIYQVSENFLLHDRHQCKASVLLPPFRLGQDRKDKVLHPQRIQSMSAIKFNISVNYFFSIYSKTLQTTACFCRTTTFLFITHIMLDFKCQWHSFMSELWYSWALVLQLMLNPHGHDETMGFIIVPKVNITCTDSVFNPRKVDSLIEPQEHQILISVRNTTMWNETCKIIIIHPNMY